MQKRGSAGRGRSHPRRTSQWAFAALILAAPAVGLVLLRLVPWDTGTPWVQLLSLFPATVMTTSAALAAAVVAVFQRPGARSIAAAALVAAVLATQLALTADRVLPSPQASAYGEQSAPRAGESSGGQRLTVMAVNVGLTGIEPGALLAEIRNRQVDVLALPELAPGSLRKLDRAGLSSLLPARVLDVDWTRTGSGLFSRFPLEQRERVPGSAFHQSRGVAVIPGASAPVHLTAVHIDSPRPGHTTSWRMELRQLGDLWQSQPAGSHSILLGDFNASLDHREFRELLGQGLTDAAQAAGKAMAPTWPINSPAPPFVAIDHVLVSPGIEVTDFQVVTLPGTDHAAVVASLLLP